MPNPPPGAPRPIPFVEFVTLLALTMSLVALSIDSILPGLPLIGHDFGIDRPNDLQFMVTLLFAGLAIGQFIAGPLSDTIGRKKTLYAGLIIFLVGTTLAYFSDSYSLMLTGRFIQGLGAAAPRIVTIAIIRDKYEGRDMARVMSYIMGVFILVPTIAPTIGLGVILLAGWHAVFIMFAVISIIIFIWAGKRLEETLPLSERRPFTLPALWGGLKTVCTNRMTACYTIAAGAIFGSLIGYINIAQPVFQDYYDTGNLFALYFGLGAFSLGIAFFVNARIVKKFGMRFVVTRAVIIMAILAALFSAYILITDTIIPLTLFMGFMMISSFCMGLCFGNLNALAMVPMGHLAGMAAAVIGAVSLIIAIIVGGAMGQFYNDNLLPIGLGFLISALTSLGMIAIAEHGNIK